MTHSGSTVPGVAELRERGVRVIRAIHPDLFGRQRAKQFPVEMLPELLEGIAYSKMSIAEDLFGIPVDSADFPELAQHPDLIAKLDAGTVFFPPWEPDSAWMLATLWEHGTRSALCSRGQLQDSLDRLDRSTGFAGVAACEPEFYLFNADEKHAAGTPYSADGVSYTVGRITDPQQVIGRIHRQLIDFGIGVTALNREFSPGQFEVNLRHSDPIAAADRVFLLKDAVKELAIIEGFRANFMAKPLSLEEGSSLHVHFSLWNGLQNVLANEEVASAPSDLLRWAIGGVQRHSAALTAFSSPTLNSYKRLAGEGLSPEYSNWGEDDRFTYLRIPAERGQATRFELRAGDASANPHLLLAAIAHAVRDGITQQIEPSSDGEALPTDLGQSLDALEHDDLLTEAFGVEFTRVYCALKRREIRAARLTVTDWEWRTYHSHV